ncbi:MAG: hypothetical protein HY981_04115 [Candidatus Magasanikbacteria bacterium]|nr:hypothetical protein [Candidatus Magasanikbacteria bacterium]
MSTIHKDVAQNNWFKMSVCEQMGNVGSEVGRAVNWQNNYFLIFYYDHTRNL